MGAVFVSLTPSRAVALRVVNEARTRGAWGHELLGTALDRSHLDERDAAFATRLAYGVLSSEGTLDEALDHHLDRPSRVHPKVRDALRLAAYELLFMRTPDRVAVHQGVEAVRSVERRATGLANAVLRRVAEEAPSFPWGDPDTDGATLARLTSHPAWLVARLIDDLGPERARTMLEADNEPAPLYLAHNPFMGTFSALMSSLEGHGVTPEAVGPPGCIVAGTPSAAVKSEALNSGACVVADAGAQFVASLAAPPPGGRGADIASGRGTKTLLMQAGSLRAGGVSEILAADVHEYKVSLLAERLAMLKVPGVQAVVADSTDPASVDAFGGPASADAVLVDAPCSGLGTLRRHPEKRWRLDETTIDTLARVGGRMLETAALLVRPGGFVVYSTCTMTERENRAVVEGFLATTPGSEFTVRPVAQAVPHGWERFVTAEGWFCSVPEPAGPDGHFAAVLVRG
ncbi:MAG: RsmB/NOP family class I SAM-dependent RNA methyltransferase [Anaerosomatales bacterium]